MPKPGRTGLARVLHATRYSVNGLRAAFRWEAAFRQELALVLPLVILALWLGHSGVERALLIGSLLLVLIVELLNSALEAVVDRVDGNWHELCERAKDMGSAAVMLSLLNVLLIWLLVLYPHYA